MAFGIIYGILNYSCPRFFNSSVKMGLHEAQIYDLQNGKGYGMFEIVHEWSTLQM
jgi:hypothetical protein